MKFALALVLGLAALAAIGTIAATTGRASDVNGTGKTIIPSVASSTPAEQPSSTRETTSTAPSTATQPKSRFLADLQASEAVGASSVPCTTGGITFARSILLTAQANIPAKLEYRSPPAGRTRIVATIGLVDGSPPNEVVRVYIQSGPTPPGGATPIVWERQKLAYGIAEQVAVTIRPGQFMRVQASAGGLRRLCLGEIRLES